MRALRSIILFFKRLHIPRLTLHLPLIGFCLLVAPQAAPLLFLHRNPIRPTLAKTPRFGRTFQRFIRPRSAPLSNLFKASSQQTLHLSFNPEELQEPQEHTITLLDNPGLQLSLLNYITLMRSLLGSAPEHSTMYYRYRATLILSGWTMCQWPIWAGFLGAPHVCQLLYWIYWTLRWLGQMPDLWRAPVRSEGAWKVLGNPRTAQDMLFR